MFEGRNAVGIGVEISEINDFWELYIHPMTRSISKSIATPEHISVKQDTEPCLGQPWSLSRSPKARQVNLRWEL